MDSAHAIGGHVTPSAVKPPDHRRGHGLEQGLNRVQAARVLTRRRLPARSVPHPDRLPPLGRAGQGNGRWTRLRREVCRPRSVTRADSRSRVLRVAARPASRLALDNPMSISGGSFPSWAVSGRLRAPGVGHDQEATPVLVCASSAVGSGARAGGRRLGFDGAWGSGEALTRVPGPERSELSDRPRPRRGRARAPTVRSVVGQPGSVARVRGQPGARSWRGGVVRVALR